jgi:putative ABC transport system permease protein
MAGITVGIPASVAVGRVIREILYGVSPMDPLTIGGTSLLLIAITLLASYVPALRATRVNPMVAMRHE